MAKKNEVKPFTIGFRGAVQEAPPFRPGLNLGCLLDIATGAYQLGAHGEMISTGGLGHLTGVGGLGNVNKSTFMHFMVLTALDRYYESVETLAHDTEYSQTYPRWQTLAANMDELSKRDLSNDPHFMISSQDDMSGNVFFDFLKGRLLSKQAARKDITFTTPFIDTREPTKRIKLMAPSIAEIDSLSALNIDVATEILDGAEVGSGKAQTVFMRAQGAKTQLMMQLPDLASQNGGYVLYSSHMGKEIKIDPYAPDVKKLQFLKNGLTFKNVPSNVTYYSTNLWMITGSVPLWTKEKTPLYPKDSSDTLEGDPDLQRITVLNLRGKGGPSGMPFDVIISQKDGVIPYLTEFHYLKAHGRYGISGNDRDYALDLYPDTKLSRTTIRTQCAKDPLLRRAMTITSELLQIKFMRPEYHEVLLSPKVLHEALVKKGYDWKELLATRGYWVFDEAASGKPPFCSTLDLLRIAAGLYTPYWKEAKHG